MSVVFANISEIFNNSIPVVFLALGAVAFVALMVNIKSSVVSRIKSPGKHVIRSE